MQKVTWLAHYYASQYKFARNCIEYIDPVSMLLFKALIEIIPAG